MNPAILTLQKRGNSFAVTIPRPFLHALAWHEGQYLELRLDGPTVEIQALDLDAARVKAATPLAALDVSDNTQP